MNDCLSKDNVKKGIEQLLLYGQKHNLIDDLDIIVCRNYLLDLFMLNEPFDGDGANDFMDDINVIISNLLDYGYSIGLIPENTVTFRDLLESRIVSIITPGQKELVRGFYETAAKTGIEVATDDFYRLSQATNYIKVKRIEKNLFWLSPSDYGDLEITVNLSKPEKDPKDIALAKTIAQTNYPKCLLCLENIGFAGNLQHPGRHNHRVIPIKLNNEDWYFQYSPYSYYNEHCIILHKNHVPMAITRETFVRLLDFLDIFPHYFIGSNADLPIVGGSILTHDHFQGGKHKFPMELAPIERRFKSDKYADINLGVVKWPMSVIRITSSHKNRLVELCCEILDKWREYSNEDADILAFSGKTPHNTITPIARKNSVGLYELDLVLRNNRTTAQFPDGIFHPHQELHHIKKENIGLIEVMGLAVLPGRLEAETLLVKDVLLGKIKLPDELIKHKDWILYLSEKYPNISEATAMDIIKDEIGKKFEAVLNDAGVYKRNKNGQNEFDKFIEFLGFSKI